MCSLWPTPSWCRCVDELLGDPSAARALVVAQAQRRDLSRRAGHEPEAHQTHARVTLGVVLVPARGPPGRRWSSIASITVVPLSWTRKNSASSAWTRSTALPLASIGTEAFARTCPAWRRTRSTLSVDPSVHVTAQWLSSPR